MNSYIYKLQDDDNEGETREENPMEEEDISPPAGMS